MYETYEHQNQGLVTPKLATISLILPSLFVFNFVVFLGVFGVPFLVFCGINNNVIQESVGEVHFVSMPSPYVTSQVGLG